MGKNREVNLVGQPVLKQIMEIATAIDINGMIRKEDENGKKITKETRELTLCRVCYQDERDLYYEFLTNNMDITAEEVAFLYKKCWTIELLFKKMKKNFQLNYFYGENSNTIYTQV